MMTYTTPDALLGLREVDVRNKGAQQGSYRRKGSGWYVTFSTWLKDEAGNLTWGPVERKVCPARRADDGRLYRIGEVKEIGYRDHVSKANETCRVPQGLATFEQFVRLRFLPDRGAKLRKAGRVHYGRISETESERKVTGMLAHVLPTLGNINLRDITPQMVQVLINAKVEAGFAPETVKKIRNTISTVLRHAKVLRFYLGDLPTEGVSLPRVVNAPKMAMTWEQVRLLIEATPPQWRLLVLFLARTGCRIGEAAGLRWKYVNLSDQYAIEDGQAVHPFSVAIWWNYTKSEWGELKNGTKSRRIIPLTYDLWGELLTWKERSPFNGPDSPVFANEVGRALCANNFASRVLKPAAKKIGLPWVSPHSFRHTSATAADAAGMTVAQRMALLGHQDSKTSDRYTHENIEQMRAKLERIQ